MIRTLLCVIGLGLLPGLLLDGAWRRAEVVYPAGILEGAHLPWSRMQPAGSVEAVNPLLSDPVYQFLPWDRVARRTWTPRGPALWNPQGGIGASLVGNPQSALLDPVRLIATGVSDRWAPLLRAWLRLVLAGTLAFGLLRHLGCGRLAAFAGAAAFEAGGFLVPWLSHPHAGVALYLPGVLWAGDRLLRGGGRGPWIALILLYAFQFLAGHPETSLHLTALAGIFWMVRAARAGWRRWLDLGAALVLGTLLAAPVLFPFVEYLIHSTALRVRAGGSGEAALPVRALAAFGIPRLFGWPLGGGAWRGALNANEMVAYVGVVPWLLAPFALLDRVHRRTALALAGVIVFSVAAGVGVWGMRQVLEVLPGFAWAANRRLLLGIAFSGAVLGGLGIDALTRRPAAVARFGAWPTALVAACATVGAAWAGADAAGVWSSFRGCPDGWLIFGGLVLIVLSLVHFALKGNVTLRWGVVLAGLLLLDLTATWRGYQPTAPSGEVFATAPSVEAIRARARPEDRVLPIPIPGRGQVFPPNTLQAFGLCDLRNYDALGNPVLRERLLAAVSVPGPVQLAADALNVFGPRFIAAAAPWERLDSAARLMPGRSHTVVFAGERFPAAIVVHSYLVGGESHVEGTRVGSLTVRAAQLDGGTEDRVFVLRAGIETADAAVPHLGNAIAHPAAAVARTFRVRDHRGRPYPRYLYRHRIPWRSHWGRPVGARVAFEAQAGYLEVDGVGLERSDGTTGIDPQRRPFFAGAILVYENPGAWPRAFLAPDPSIHGGLPSRAEIRAAEIHVYEPDRVVVRGEARDGEVLVITDAWAEGWSAVETTRGRKAVGLEPAYGLFRAVRVPPGSFSVTLRYAPWALTMGLFAVLVVLFLVAARLALHRSPD